MAKPLSCFIVTIQTPDGVEQKIVDEKSFTIGRSLDAIISCSDPNMSRIHLVVSYKHDRVWIEDQDSANGTFLNGEQIHPRKLTPVNPEDVVTIGKGEVSYSFDVVEKCYQHEDVKSSPLAKVDRESLMALVHGAHAEAQRLVKLGQENHDKMLKLAEQKAYSIEHNMLLKQDDLIQAATAEAGQIVQEAKKKASQVVLESQHEAQKAVEGVHRQAEEVRQQAEKYFQEQIELAQQKGDEILAQSTQTGQEMIQEARNKVQLMRDQTQSEIQTQKFNAQKDVDGLIEAAQERAEKLEQSLIEETKAETRRQMELVLQDLRDKALDQRDEMLEEARLEKENLLEAARAEVEKIKTEGEKEISRLQSEISQFKNESAQKREERDQWIQKLTEQQKEFSDRHEKFVRELDGKQQQAKAERDEEWSRLQNEIKLREKNAQEHLKALRIETQDVQKALDEKNREFSQVSTKIDKAQAQLRELDPLYSQRQKEMEEWKKSSEKLQSLVKDLEQKQGRVSLQLQALNEQVDQQEKTFSARSAEQAAKLKAEFQRLKEEQDKNLDMIKLEDLERVRKIREEMIEEVFKEKEKISIEALNGVEREVVKIMKASDWSQISAAVKSSILQAIEEKTTSLSTAAQSHKADTRTLPQKQKAQKIRWMAQGLALGLLCFYVGQQAYVKFQQDENPMKTAAEEEARQRALDLERRKFDPPTVEELKDTYVDAVIYTRQFVENYLSPDFQEKWLKGATSYLLKQWRIQEEKTIEILSRVNTLIKTLDEKKKNIHPDFVNEGLAKMNELELENETELKEMLGSEVKYQAFRRFEKRFYLNEFQSRGPAQETPPLTKCQEDPSLGEADGCSAN